jgi:DNA-binding winged helix-turn-helix (wHTH) protein
MTAIYDGNGNEIADIGLSDKQRALLEADEEIVLIYHTPQTLRYLLGEHSGSFVLRKKLAQIVVSDVDRLRAFADLQRAIKAAREQH